jgi:hypothetical protein
LDAGLARFDTGLAAATLLVEAAARWVECTMRWVEWPVRQNSYLALLASLLSVPGPFSRRVSHLCIFRLSSSLNTRI